MKELELALLVVSFPDTSHPMNKGSDRLVRPRDFETYLLDEMRRQALNEVILSDPNRLPVLHPPLVMETPFPPLLALVEDVVDEKEVCRCFWCNG